MYPFYNQTQKPNEIIRFIRQDISSKDGEVLLPPYKELLNLCLESRSQFPSSVFGKDKSQAELRRGLEQRVMLARDNQECGSFGVAELK